MDDIKFSCPGCSQHFACDPQWSGREIQCPSCQAMVTVPPPPAVALPNQPKSGVRRVVVAPKSAMVRTGARPAASPASGMSGSTKKALVISAVIAVVAVAAVVALKVVPGWQADPDDSGKADTEALAGRPARTQQMSKAPDATEAGNPATEPALTNATQEPAPEKTASAPPAPASAWTLNVEEAKISKDKAAGTLSGDPFVVETAFLDSADALNILSLRQGTNSGSDRELLIYLYLKSGETIGGHTWTVSKDTRIGAPQIIKRWKPPLQTVLRQRTIANGYAMKLEFGQPNGTNITGKIYVGLPDQEQSFLSGEFTAPMRTLAIKQPAPAVARVTNAPNPYADSSQGAAPKLPRVRNPGGGYSVPMPPIAIP